MSKTVLVLGALGVVIVAVGAWLLGQPSAPEPPAFASDAQRHAWVMNTLLPWMEQFRERYHNVPRSDGEFLRWLVIATKRRKALEIGTANGYSAIWLGLGLEVTKGRLTTIEIKPDLVREAKANLKRAGLLERVVTVVEGDALKVVPQLPDKFDFAFIDIGPRALPFVEAVLPKLTDDAIIAVHRPPFEGALSDYLAAMRKRPEWLTTIVQTGAPTAIVLSVRVPKR
ncbi:class I SAM-dependent methyltransferase [Fervidibacter sacchari]|uniref:O-methyltransferase YrrM n=1 Tax=Candidatus Fervidibacter sacchari TaxID=1448929 RepID=A0ABT2EP04_9BACT|nr:class I SAM-dependent methyltransferase [Candidatus Fervidibacter sacchari]MCS3919166.1 putative O-methyltransferase YrrM [Candidatus Fervidibacter sacchari]WKU17102.1 class I SAM-dependent methyltransferase [Candidatus Fervidibacter sacchari]